MLASPTMITLCAASYLWRTSIVGIRTEWRRRLSLHTVS